MAGIRWIQKDIEFLKENYPKFGIEYCASKLNRSKQIKDEDILSLYKTSIELGKQNKFSDSAIREVLKSRGFTVEEINQALPREFTKPLDILSNAALVEFIPCW